MAFEKGGLLALDWGKKKVGFATTDEGGLVVTPQGHWLRKDRAENPWMLTASDQKEIEKLCDEYEPGALVLGLPLNADGTESEGSRGARALALDLEEGLKKKVYLVNEVLTSWASKGTKDDNAEAAALLLKDLIFQKLESRNGFSTLGILASLILGLVILLGLGAAWAYSNFALKPASQGSGNFIVDVPPQSTLRTVRVGLEKNGFLIDRNVFRFWVLFHPEAKKLRIGEYQIDKSWSAEKILTEIINGHVILHTVTVKEGYNIYDIDELFESPEVPPTWKAEFKHLIHDPKYLSRVGIPSSVEPSLRSLEGFLFPETYSFQKYDTLHTVVESMLSQFEKRALPILSQHPWGQSPGGIYRLLTLASIVEKESGSPLEQPTVASVFWNRIQKKMRLQSDPTTVYGLLPNFDGRIRKADLLRPTPFNTYTVNELPAGPISNPGESALRAVVNPAKTDFLYFVSKGDGTHIFAKDLKSHNDNVIRYQLGGRSPTSGKKSLPVRLQQ